MKILRNFISEPYRIFFPLGTLLLLVGILLWLPLLWNPDVYPIVLHRYLMLNGFTACFIGGFLMTAVPRFSKTYPARIFEVSLFFLVTLTGVLFAIRDNEKMMMLFSGLQPLVLLFFLFSRISKRKENPPYSFVFIFVGLLLWFFSGIYGFSVETETLKRLHYEGAVASIILGVGSRLIPGILGHVEIVSVEKSVYERPTPLYKVVPLYFFLLMVAFIASYFLREELGNWVRFLVVGFMGIHYWRLYKLPKEKTALTFCIWTAAWLILLSFFLRALWWEGMIHASHAFFINGIVLLSFLIGTRVLQSHGPKLKSLENHPLLYVVTFFIVISAITRVSAYLMPDQYLGHLGYSSLVLSLATIIWSIKYLRFAVVFPTR